MSIYKAGRPWKYDPTTGAGHRPPNSPGEYRMRDGLRLHYIHRGDQRSRPAYAGAYPQR